MAPHTKLTIKLFTLTMKQYKLLGIHFFVVLISGFLVNPAILAQQVSQLIQSGLPEYRLAPLTWNIEGFRQRMNNLSPTESIEAYLKIDFPQDFPNDQSSRLEALKNALGSISTLKNVLYRPDSHNPGKHVFLDAVVVDSPSGQVRMNDLDAHSLSDSAELYAKIVNRGNEEVVMGIKIEHENRFRVQMENITPIRLFFVNLINSGDLVFNLDIDYTGDHLELYSTGGLRTFNIGLLRPAIRHRLRDFTYAIIEWLLDGLQIIY